MPSMKACNGFVPLVNQNRPFGQFLDVFHPLNIERDCFLAFNTIYSDVFSNADSPSTTAQVSPCPLACSAKERQIGPQPETG